MVRNHGIVSCFPCGWVIEEPRRQAWDLVSNVRGAANHPGPQWTPTERLEWQHNAKKEARHG